MKLEEIYENESAWERSGQSNAARLSDRHIEIMTVLIEIRNELRTMNLRQYEEACVRENTPRRYSDNELLHEAQGGLR